MTYNKKPNQTSLIDSLCRPGLLNKIPAKNKQNSKNNHRKSRSIAHSKIAKPGFINPGNQNMCFVCRFSPIANQPDDIKIIKCPDYSQRDRRDHNRFD